jgi:dihydroflavonol-4-reductase
MGNGQTVLVTGGSGYIGGWCVAILLQHGYIVRTTVRDLARSEKVRAAVSRIVDPGDRLSFFAANLSDDDGWQEAADGCDFVMHVASPLGVPEPRDPQDLIRPARDGAIRVLRAAIRAGVGRVVMTSSVAATSLPPSKADTVADETIWTDATDSAIGPYAQSKTLAERAAWELMGEASGETTLATVNPALVAGPVMGSDFSESVQVVQRLMTGKVPGVPRLGFNVVDVRDVADLHLRAMTAPEAAGQRFVAASGFRWMSDIAELLRRELGPAASKVPTRGVPDFVIRLASLVDHDLRSVTRQLSRRHDYTSAKAQSLLGWRPRGPDETILDCARSLIEHGAV